MPTDTTPDPRDMQRAPEAQRIPQTREGPAHGKPDVARRPPLPDDPQVMAAGVARDPTAAPAAQGDAPGFGEGDSELNGG